MQIFIITLAEALDRQQQASDQLREQGLDFRFFPAISGQTALEGSTCPVKERQFLLATGRKITPGELGCFLSHRLLWKLCVRLNEPILVMEDDFRLSPEFSAAVSCLEHEIREYGLIRLQSERRARKQPVKSLGAFRLWRYTKAPNSAMCYGLSPDAAALLLSKADEIAAPLDVYMKRFWTHGQRMYGITPYTVTESNLSESTQITGRVKARKGLYTRMQRIASRVADLVARTQYNIRFALADRFVTALPSDKVQEKEQAI